MICWVGSIFPRQHVYLCIQVWVEKTTFGPSEWNESLPKFPKETEGGLVSVNGTEPQDTMSYLEDSSFQYTEHQQES